MGALRPTLVTTRRSVPVHSSKIDRKDKKVTDEQAEKNGPAESRPIGAEISVQLVDLVAGPPPQRKIDYAALVAADEAKASSTPTLDQIVRDNLEHFEGFARARAKQRRAVAMVAEITGSDPESVRRTFLKVYGRWDTFSRGVRADGLSDSPAATIEEPPAVGLGPMVWE